MQSGYFVDRLKCSIDFISSTRFRLTTPYRQREFEVNRTNRFINAETLEPINLTAVSRTAFCLVVNEHVGMDPKNDTTGYVFKAQISDRNGVVGETTHLKPLMVEFKMMRKK